MLHIALVKLAACGTNEMVSGQIWPSNSQCHAILQLIAKAECATHLIESRPSPNAATQGLIQQPAVQQEIELPVRCFHLNLGKYLLPRLLHSGKRCGYLGFPVSPDQLAGMSAIMALSQQENNLGALVGLEFDDCF